MPDRAGAKLSWRDVGLFVFKVLPSIPGFIASRPSVVDPRVHEAGVPSPHALYRLTRALIIQFIKKIKAEKGYERIGAVGLALANAQCTPQLMCSARYCFGGSMAGRLGSTDSVNTIVIAHPSGLTPAQVRAIKVGNSTSNSCPPDGLTRFSPQVPSCWVLAEGNTLFSFSMCTKPPFITHYRGYVLQRQRRPGSPGHIKGAGGETRSR
jgi:hypothetical protein